MIMAALVANRDSSLFITVVAALGVAKAAHQIVIVDGNPNHYYHTEQDRLPVICYESV
jgi:hypothetical protein